MGLISGFRYLKENLKAKMDICVTTKGVPTKLLKFFWLKIFLICHRCQRHRWSTLSREYFREFSKKIRNGPNGILWGWGETDWWKNQKRKISWHCPFKNYWGENRFLPTFWVSISSMVSKRVPTTWSEAIFWKINKFKILKRIKKFRFSVLLKVAGR
jgi:hypothetical protein